MEGKIEIPKETEVVIIGGGVLGLATAYNLAKKGDKDIVLIERKELGAESSGANCAALMTCRMPPRLAFSKLTSGTARAATHLSEELGRDIEYKPGKFTVLQEEQVEKWRAYCDQLHEMVGVDVRIIGPDELHRLQPDMYYSGAKHIFFDPIGGMLNVLYYLTAMGDMARELGTKIYEYTEALDIRTENGSVKSVVTNRGEIKARYVVNACGFGAPRIGEMVGLKIPLSPLKCHVCVTEELPPIVNMGGITRGTKFVANEVAETMLVYPSFRQMVKGNILLCVVEGPGDDKWETFETLERISHTALEHIPILKEMSINIIRTYGNLYHVTPDRLPILGKVKGLEGFILACGGNDYGVGVSYMVGKVVSELICSGETSVPLDDFSLSRFG